METKRYNMKKRSKWTFITGGIILLTAIVLLFLDIEFTLGQLIIPNTLITIGLVSIAISLKNYFITKEIKYDERDQLIILKSSKNTLAILIYIASISMLIGTVQKISVDLMLVSSVLLFGTIIIYKISYNYFNKKN
ncbi:DUF2178 domain-containing protein [Patescibacteria group bacterium]|nr:DUF2178 domain-containing protein [Patescibacteria group bacterium]